MRMCETWLIGVLADEWIESCLRLVSICAPNGMRGWPVGELFRLIITRVALVAIINAAFIWYATIYIIGAFQDSVNTLENSIGRQTDHLSALLVQQQKELSGALETLAVLARDYGEFEDRLGRAISDVQQVRRSADELLARSLPPPTIELGVLRSTQSNFLELVDSSRRTASFSVIENVDLRLEPTDAAQREKQYLYVALFKREGESSVFVQDRSVFNETYPLSRAELIFRQVIPGDYYLFLSSPKRVEFKLSVEPVQEGLEEKEK